LDFQRTQFEAQIAEEVDIMVFLREEEGEEREEEGDKRKEK
jgi:hypothetical protein